MSVTFNYPLAMTIQGKPAAPKGAPENASEGIPLIAPVLQQWRGVCR